MSGKSVFIIGPGYIGWNILDILVSEGYKVTGLVRRKEHAAQLEASGAPVIFGDLDDKELLSAQVASHDITFHTATADHLPSVEAVLDGLRQRTAAGKEAVFIHTSGTNITADDAAGNFLGNEIYEDTDIDKINAIPHSKPHRFVDIPITQAMNEPALKNAKIAVMVPPTIFGVNPKHQRLSIQIPYLTRFALKHGYAPYVGKGLSVESQIHVLDLARAYVTLLHHMESSPNAVSELHANPFFFCENGVEASWKDVASEIGKGLHGAGEIPNAEPKTVPESLYGDLFGEGTVNGLGLNSRSRAVRLRQLGWQPREKRWREAYHEDELPLLLEEANGK